MARLALTVAVVLSLLAISFSRPVNHLPAIRGERDPRPSFTTSDMVDTAEETEEDSLPSNANLDAVEYVMVPLHRLADADLYRDEPRFSLRLPSHRHHHRLHQRHHPCKGHRSQGGSTSHRHWFPHGYPGADGDNDEKTVHMQTTQWHDEPEFVHGFPGRIRTDRGDEAEVVRRGMVEEEIESMPGSDVGPKDDEHDDDENGEEELEKKWWMENGLLRPHHHHRHHHRHHRHHHHHGDDDQEEGGLMNWIHGLFDRF